MQKALRTIDIDGKFYVFIITLESINIDINDMLVRLIANHKKAKLYNML